MSKLFEEFVSFAKKSFDITIEENEKGKEVDFSMLFGFDALEIELLELPEQIALECFDFREEFIYQETTPLAVRAKKSQIYDELHSDFAYAA